MLYRILGPISIRHGKHLIGPRISAIEHLLNEDHCVRTRALAEIVDEHRSGAMDQLLLLRFVEGGLRQLEICEGHILSPGLQHIGADEMRDSVCHATIRPTNILYIVISTIWIFMASISTCSQRSMR